VRVKLAIKPEDLDAVIEAAMSYETDYNFSIDTSGNIYKGRVNSTVVNKKSSSSPSNRLERGIDG